MTSGLHPAFDASTASPRDYVMIGIADDCADISNSEGEITTKDELISYLTNIPSIESFVPANAATSIWNDLTTLNGG